MTRERPAGKEIGHQSNRCIHHTRITIFIYPFNRTLLYLTDRTQLLVVYPHGPFETDSHTIVHQMSIDQPFQQSERGPFQRAATVVVIIYTSSIRIVCLISPTVPYGSITKPVNAILLTGSADKGIINLRVRQSLGRFRPYQCINSFFQEIMSKVQGDKSCHFIPQLIAHFLEMTLEVKVLLFAVCSQRIHSRSKTTDIPAILFTVIHTQPTVAQFFLEKIEYTVGNNELRPISARPRTRDISPKVKQIQVSFLYLGNDLFQIILKNQRIGNPQNIPELILIHPLIEFLFIISGKVT